MFSTSLAAGENFFDWVDCGCCFEKGAGGEGTCVCGYMHFFFFFFFLDK